MKNPPGWAGTRLNLVQPTGGAVLCDAADKRRSAGGTGANSLLPTMSAFVRITDS